MNTLANISTELPDWSRESKTILSWQPSRSLLASIRAYQLHSTSTSPFRIFARKMATLRHMFWSVVTGADIPLNCHIGGGLLLPHPNGVVIHPSSHIGVNCLIFQQVTIGERNMGIPTIGSHVDIGAGAKILGGITIGDNALIGANAVVLENVPPNCSAVGIPATIKKQGTPNR